MKHTINWLMLASSMAIASGVSAADQPKNSKVAPVSAMKVVTDKQGNVRRFEPTDEAALSGQKLQVGKNLSARLSIPKVTQVQAAKNGATMVEIGLDEYDYLVVTQGDQGKPVVTHQSSANQVLTAEEQ